MIPPYEALLRALLSAIVDSNEYADCNFSTLMSRKGPILPSFRTVKPSSAGNEIRLQRQGLASRREESEPPQLETPCFGHAETDPRQGGYINELPYKGLATDLRALTLVLMADMWRSGRTKTAGLAIIQVRKWRCWRYERLEADEGFVVDH